VLTPPSSAVQAFGLTVLFVAICALRMSRWNRAMAMLEASVDLLLRSDLCFRVVGVLVKPSCRSCWTVP